MTDDEKAKARLDGLIAQRVPCGFCGKPTYPGLKWPSPEDPRVYLWCCDDCEYELTENDGRVISATVLLPDGVTEN